MSMAEPFMPHPPKDEEIAASDPGPGAPGTAPGTGVEGEDADARRSAEQGDDEQHDG
jgi:hypothetical protein